ncbi:HNH endonuclease signature motif containing protein [Mycolicibacterium sp. J2]|uniref:HNH endonuclease signature motif containing protein n=1 Tax=Mycolicibacterium sp. J2 TaxID=2993511 RepID=UPI00224B9419|nr:HNH endonuclease signature motif containing protein [Mycolicibacterium sp. J2]MCX2710687.1 HNH endonuclease signature motif containing protein [Mycolicibacterium sp. J2]
MEGIGDLAAIVDKLSTTAFGDVPVAELLEAQSALEQVFRQLPAIQHRVMAAVKAQSSPAEFGIRSWADLLSIRLRISNTEASRRLTEGELLAPRRSMAGDPLEPQYPATAAALARGELSAEHVRIITRTMKKIPPHVDAQTRARAEVDLAAVASMQAPEALRRMASLLLELVDPDGPEPNDEGIVDRRQMLRQLILGPQDADGMSDLRARITPEFRAYLEPSLGKLAAIGMCNPDDDTPCTKGTPSAEAVAADARSLGQRQHDALMTIARSALASGDLGEHNGLPVTVVVTTTVTELEDAAGVARTGGGSMLPMCDLIRMAGHARHYLTVFDGHAAVPLYLGRAKRIASPGQRLVLHARDRGCTYPGCSVSAYLCQSHHAETDYRAGGQTDIPNLGLACGPHNRLVKEGGWKTRIRGDGRVEWIPPPQLDAGPPRLNLLHHPEDLFGHEGGYGGEHGDDP